MNIKKLIIFIILLISLTNNAYTDITNKIITIIGKKIITQYDINKEEKHLNFVSQGQFDQLSEKEKNQVAKENLIRQRIKENEFSKYTKIEISDEKLNYYVNKSINSMGFTTKDDFKNNLLEFGLDYDEYLNKLNIEIMWNQLISNLYLRSITVDPKKIEKKIEILKKNNYVQEFLISEIFVTADSVNLLNEKSSLITKSISEIGFHNSAIKYSISETARNSGRLGWVPENQLSKEIRSSIKELKNNKVTNAINVNGGALILYIEDKRKTKISIDLKKTFDKLVLIEKNQQIARFSLSHYNKIKNNTLINELQ
jgi:peptidyl-prolyl cis-trans isomerase SurA